MRLLDISTKYFDNETFGVPKMENNWGSMIDLFDATLVLGSASQDILQIDSIEDPLYPEKYWLATLVLNTTHNFKANLSVIKITDCSVPVYNDTFRVQTITSNSITIAFDKSVVIKKPENVSYTYGMKLTTPPLGFEKVFSGPQKAVYKVKTKSDKYCYLRVDNSCPSDHDPSWSKFSRVSMFEDIKDIEDYKFRPERKKSPAFLDDYNRVEESIQNVWMGTRWYSTNYHYFQNPPNTPNKKYILIGDSSTLYFHIEKIVDYNDDQYRRDETYVFGEYIKYIYKEDPLPFILRTTQREHATSGVFYYHQNYTSLTRDRDIDNHTFNTDSHRIFEIPYSHRFALWLTDSFRSGGDTRVNFKPYKNEINLNLTDMELRFFRTDNVVLEGRYRGLKAIMCNITDYPAKAPRYYEIFKDKAHTYIHIPDRDRSSLGSFAIKLNDWG